MPNGAAPSAESLKLARTIIENRVNGIDVSGSEVIIDGNNLVITVPSGNGGQAKSPDKNAQILPWGRIDLGGVHQIARARKCKEEASASSRLLGGSTLG